MSQHESRTSPLSENTFTAGPVLFSGIFLGFVALGLVLLITFNLEIEWTLEYWEPRSVVARNIGLIAIAIPALLLAWSRTNSATRQADTANKQAVTAEHGLNIDRYQKGAEMLGSKDLLVRIAGIQTLRELASSHGPEYYLQVAPLLASFACATSQPRRLTGGFWSENIPRFEALTSDSLEALRAISSIRSAFSGWREKEVEAETSLVFESGNFSEESLIRLNLSFCRFRKTIFSGCLLTEADLSNAHFDTCDFSHARLVYARVRSASFVRCKFTRTDFYSADLSRAILRLNDLSTADFDAANISGTSFTPKKIEQARLQYAWAWFDRRPSGLPSAWGWFWKRFSPGENDIGRHAYEASGSMGEPEDAQAYPWSPLNDEDK
ncbi:pentapeptide repeat-containing protein [Roseibium polysiphoniae]|uniref:Pentapeptide repeat-containing protein n=1 Tax=Roseibium polysiphoniae TaxID=2571221 RepID=A0A944CC42_9HYPH|nr:pentapeptide repeat-containing protein [Roseibium polysiphoniae]MBS8259744.1 pentapeptide repeat-containing protein [Roseibium polysiphoniae]